MPATITHAPTRRAGVMDSGWVPNRSASSGDMSMVMMISVEKISEVFKGLT